MKKKQITSIWQSITVHAVVFKVHRTTHKNSMWSQTFAVFIVYDSLNLIIDVYLDSKHSICTLKHILSLVQSSS